MTEKQQPLLKRPAIQLTLIVILALVIRIGYAWAAVRVDPALRANPLHGDAAGYIALAEHLRAGEGLSFDGVTPTAFRLPGYPVFLAGVFSASSSGEQAARLFQALLGALTCIPVFLLARRLMGERWAWLAGLGVALHPILLYMTGWLYSETLYIFLLWFGLLFLVYALGEASYRWGILAGIVLGLAGLVRPEAITLLFFVLVGGLFWGWRRRLLVVAVAQLFVFAVLTPWVVRNYNTQGGFVLATTSTGVTLHDANNELARGGSYHEGEWILPGYSEIESSAEFGSQAIEWIRSNPGEFLGLLPLKLYKFFSPVEMDSAPESPLGRLALPVTLAYFAFLLVAAWGMASTWSRSTTKLMAALILEYVLLALVFHGSTRVALPLAPGLMIFAAVGLKALLERRRAPTSAAF